jgi:N-acetylneuraminic acid mutarotase
MPRNFLLLIFLFQSVRLISQNWTQLSDFPATERDDGIGIVTGGKAYFGSGLRAGTGVGGDFYALDLATHVWGSITPMPSGSERQYATAFANANYFFVCGGMDNSSNVLNNTYRYDIAANTWSLMAPKPGTPVFAACSFTLNNKAYIVGGRYGNDNQVCTEVWEYNLSNNSWTQKNNFPFKATWRGSAATLSNYGYVFSGKDDNLAYHRELYRYDAVSDTWTKAADFPSVKRYYARMENVGNKLIIFGGIDSLDNFFNEAWYYEAGTGFTLGPSLPAAARKGGMSAASTSKFYYTCGVNASGRLKQTWALDVPVGISENNREKVFQIYPNPVAENIHIVSESQRILNLTLVNLSGEIIFQREMIREENIDVSELSPGIFLLRIADENGYFVKKFFKSP